LERRTNQWGLRKGKLFHKENEFAVKDFPDFKKIYICAFTVMLVREFCWGRFDSVLQRVAEKLSKVCWVNKPPLKHRQ
jgi:hypothetical protein